jgi:hypothetical protein
LVEQSIRNRQVIGSSPIVGSRKPVVSCWLPLASYTLLPLAHFIPQKIVDFDLRSIMASPVCDKANRQAGG